MTICEIIERNARRGPNWHVQKLEAVTGGIIVTGHEYHNYKIGPKKGQPNRRKRIAYSFHQFFLTNKEYDAIIQESKQ